MPGDRPTRNPGRRSKLAANDSIAIHAALPPIDESPKPRSKRARSPTPPPISDAQRCADDRLVMEEIANYVRNSKEDRRETPCAKAMRLFACAKWHRDHMRGSDLPLKKIACIGDAISPLEYNRIRKSTHLTFLLTDGDDCQFRQWEDDIFLQYKSANGVVIPARGYDDIGKVIFEAMFSWDGGLAKRNMELPTVLKAAEVIPADKSDKRGVTSIVRATRDICQYEIIGFYSGRVMTESDLVCDTENTVFTRYQKEYKVMELWRGCEIGGLKISKSLLEDLREANAIDDNGTYTKAVFVDGAECANQYKWTSEICDCRTGDVYGGKDCKMGPFNVKLMTILVMGWPIICIVSIKKIKRGQELLMNYGEEHWRGIKELYHDQLLLRNTLEPLQKIINSLQPMMDRALATLRQVETLIASNVSNDLESAEFKDSITHLLRYLFTTVPALQNGGTLDLNAMNAWAKNMKLLNAWKSEVQRLEVDDNLAVRPKSTPTRTTPAKIKASVTGEPSTAHALNSQFIPSTRILVDELKRKYSDKSSQSQSDEFDGEIDTIHVHEDDSSDESHLPSDSSGTATSLPPSKRLRGGSSLYGEKIETSLTEAASRRAPSPPRVVSAPPIVPAPVPVKQPGIASTRKRALNSLVEPPAKLPRLEKPSSDSSKVKSEKDTSPKVPPKGSLPGPNDSQRKKKKKKSKKHKRKLADPTNEPANSSVQPLKESLICNSSGCLNLSALCQVHNFKPSENVSSQLSGLQNTAVPKPVEVEKVPLLSGDNGHAQEEKRVPLIAEHMQNLNDGRSGSVHDQLATVESPAIEMDFGYSEDAPSPFSDAIEDDISDTKSPETSGLITDQRQQEVPRPELPQQASTTGEELKAIISAHSGGQEVDSQGANNEAAQSKYPSIPLTMTINSRHEPTWTNSVTPAPQKFLQQNSSPVKNKESKSKLSSAPPVSTSLASSEDDSSIPAAPDGTGSAPGSVRKRKQPQLGSSPLKIAVTRYLKGNAKSQIGAVTSASNSQTPKAGMPAPPLYDGGAGSDSSSASQTPTNDVRATRETRTPKIGTTEPPIASQIPVNSSEVLTSTSDTANVVAPEVMEDDSRTRKNVSLSSRGRSVATGNTAPATVVTSGSQASKDTAPMVSANTSASRLVAIDDPEPEPGTTTLPNQSRPSPAPIEVMDWEIDEIEITEVKGGLNKILRAHERRIHAELSIESLQKRSGKASGRLSQPGSVSVGSGCLGGRGQPFMNLGFEDDIIIIEDG